MLIVFISYQKRKRDNHRKRLLEAPAVAGIGTESARAFLDSTGEGEDHPILHPVPFKPKTNKKSKGSTDPGSASDSD